MQENLANLPMQPTKSSVLLAPALLEKNMPRASSEVFSFWNAAWQRGQIIRTTILPESYGAFFRYPAQEGGGGGLKFRNIHKKKNITPTLGVVIKFRLRPAHTKPK